MKSVSTYFWQWLSLEKVLCGYTYLQVSYKVHLLSMKATQAQEGAQVQETEDREKRAETAEPATENSHERRWAVTLGVWLYIAWLSIGVVIYRCSYL